MKNSIKYFILNLSIWKLFTYIWDLWLFILNKTSPKDVVENLDEFNKASYYIIKYLGLPFLIIVITFLLSFTDIGSFVHGSHTIHDIKELQQYKKW